MLYYTLKQLIEGYAQRPGAPETSIAGSAVSPWEVDLEFSIQDDEYQLRSLAAGDEAVLASFASRLGTVAREMFCPYPWADETACGEAFRQAVAQSMRRVDASYLLTRNGDPIGHFFLWKAGGNPVSRMAGLEVPELGVAIADAYTGKGLGSLAVRFLLAMAADLGADAVELTTAADNDAGWLVYQRAGFTFTGLLRIPLDVDVTAADAGEVVGTRFRTERQMVHILQPSKTDAIVAYLGSKR